MYKLRSFPTNARLFNEFWNFTRQKANDDTGGRNNTSVSQTRKRKRGQSRFYDSPEDFAGRKYMYYV